MVNSCVSIREGWGFHCEASPNLTGLKNTTPRPRAGVGLDRRLFYGGCFEQMVARDLARSGSSR